MTLIPKLLKISFAAAISSSVSVLVKGAPEKHVIALGLEGEYYAYRCQDGYEDMPATLGELFDQYNLAKVLELDRFAEQVRGLQTADEVGAQKGQDDKKDHSCWHKCLRGKMVFNV